MSFQFPHKIVGSEFKKWIGMHIFRISSNNANVLKRSLDSQTFALLGQRMCW